MAFSSRRRSGFSPSLAASFALAAAALAACSGSDNNHRPAPTVTNLEGVGVRLLDLQRLGFEFPEQIADGEEPQRRPRQSETRPSPDRLQRLFEPETLELPGDGLHLGGPDTAALPVDIEAEQHVLDRRQRALVERDLGRDHYPHRLCGLEVRAALRASAFGLGVSTRDDQQRGRLRTPTEMSERIADVVLVDRPVLDIFGVEGVTRGIENPVARQDYERSLSIGIHSKRGMLPNAQVGI